MPFNTGLQYDYLLYSDHQSSTRLNFRSPFVITKGRLFKNVSKKCCIVLIRVIRENKMLLKRKREKKYPRTAHLTITNKGILADQSQLNISEHVGVCYVYFSLVFGCNADKTNVGAHLNCVFCTFSSGALR